MALKFVKVLIFITKFINICGVSDFVQYGHGISNSAYVDFSQSYLLNLLLTPLVLLVAGVLSIVFLNVGFSCRRRYQSCSCELNTEPPAGISVIEWVKKIEKTGRFYSKCLFLVCLFILLAEQCLIISFISLNSSIQSTTSTVQSIGHVMNTLNTVGLDMKANGDSLLLECNNTYFPCLNQGNKTQLVKYITNYKSRISDYQTLSQNMVNFIDVITPPIQNYAPIYPLVILGIIYILGVFSSLFFIVSQLFKSPDLMRISRIYGQWVLGCIVFINSFVAIALSFLSDFCVSSTTSFVRLSRTSSSMLNLTMYYITCQNGRGEEGASQLAETLNGARATAVVINSTLHTLRFPKGYSTTCASEISISAMKKITTAIFQEMSSLQPALHCSSVQSFWKDLTEKSLCSDLLDALAYLWISQMFVFVLLFIAVLLGSVTHYYFDRFDLTLPSEPDDAEDYDIEEYQNGEVAMAMEHQSKGDSLDRQGDGDGSVKVAWSESPGERKAGTGNKPINTSDEKAVSRKFWGPKRFRRRNNNKVDVVSFADDLKDIQKQP